MYLLYILIALFIIIFINCLLYIFGFLDELIEELYSKPNEDEN